MIGYRSAYKSQSGPSGDVVAETISFIVDGQIVPQPSYTNGIFANNPSSYFNVVIGNNVGFCNNMFYNCRNLNQSITIPNNVISCANMFKGCVNLNQDIFIPKSVKFHTGMFSNCNNFGATVIFEGKTYLHSRSGYGSTQYDLPVMFDGVNGSYTLIFTNNDPTNFCVAGILGGVYTSWGKYNASYKKILKFNRALNSVFNRTNLYVVLGSYYMTGAVISSDDSRYNTITWTSMTNGFYNQLYNIYCYNNYPI